MILTTYLTSKPDPQRGGRTFVERDNPLRLLALEGCRRLGLRAVVFHDELSPEFCREHATDRIQFVKVRPLDGYSCNDARFFYYRDWLASHRYRSVFCSDLFDVRVNRDPHALLTPEFDLMVGVHNEAKIGDTRGDGRNIRRRLRWYYSDKERAVCSGKPALMAGTWGGWYEPVVLALSILTAEIEAKKGLRSNCNLPVFQMVIHRDFPAERVWMRGAPLHSRFREKQRQADVAFVHK